MKKLLIMTISLTTLFLFWCQQITNTQTEISIEKQTGENIEEIVEPTEEATWFIIQSFNDCLNAGFPIMESYPRQCNDGTTTYVEEISQENTQKTTTGNNITWENLDTQSQQATWNTVNVLQQKLKAMVERRNQKTQNNSWIISATPTNNTGSATNTNEQVTEEDIENLEKIIEEIIKN